MRSLAVASLLLIVALVYAPTWRYPFLYEDVRDGARIIQPWAGWASWWAETRQKPARSLNSLVNGLSERYLGIEAGPWHLVSVVLHAVNTLLVFWLAGTVFPLGSAWAAAAIFAAHPMQVEAVAYVSARADVLSTTFVLLALCAASLGSVAGAVVGVALACLAKESAVVAAGLVPLWASWVGAAFPVRRWLLTGAALLPVGAVAAWGFAGEPSRHVDMMMLAEQLTVIWRLVGYWLVPVGFTIDHDWAGLPWLLWPVSVALLLFLLVLLSDNYRLRFRMWAVWAAIFTVVALCPRLVLSLYEGMHERHFYTASIAWALAAGWWLTPYADRKPTWV